MAKLFKKRIYIQQSKNTTAQIEWHNETLRYSTAY